MTGILEKLKWESLKEKRKESRLIMLYKGWRVQQVYLRMTLFPQLGIPGSITLWHYIPPLANTDTYKCSFFPQTNRDWNSLTDSLISATESVCFFPNKQVLKPFLLIWPKFYWLLIFALKFLPLNFRLLIFALKFYWLLISEVPHWDPLILIQVEIVTFFNREGFQKRIFQ